MYQDQAFYGAKSLIQYQFKYFRPSLRGSLMPQNIQSTINLTIKTSERVFGDSLFDGNYTFEKEVIGYIYVACTL